MLRKLQLSLLLLTLVSIFMSTAAFAVPADGASRTYSIGRLQRTGANNMHGGYMYSTIPDVTSNWTSTYNKRFVQKGLWVNINGDIGNDWIESGYREGAKFNLTYMKGNYMAYALTDSNGILTYTERAVPFGPTPTVGSSHHYKTIYLGDSTLYWRATIDGTYNWDVYGWAGDGYQDIGFEASTSVATINVGNYITDIQYYEDGTWRSWTSAATMTNTDPYLTGFLGSFTNSTHTNAYFTQ